ncbi:MAG: azurin [Gammaproteobacteria bacterium]|nr:azurin [Gammaproteobacteria bacterium]
MKHALLSSASILAITAVTLFSAVAVADDGAADNVAEECRLTIDSTDQMQYDKSELSVPASCETVSLTLTHSGSMAKNVMGHNWVLAPTDAYQEIASAGMQAGLDSNYLPEDDRILAATDIIGGGESTSITFDTEGLADQDLTFFCSFPGHSSMMKGSFSLTSEG